MSSVHRIPLVTLLAASLAGAAEAQRVEPPPRPMQTEWTHGTTLTLEGGLATGQSDTGAVAGAAMGWEITPRLRVEGSGLWLDRNPGDAFNAAIKVRAALRAGLSPFGETGFGLYHWTTSSAPVATPAAGTAAQQSATDPVFHFGGGVNLFTSRHFAIEPVAQALVVLGNDGSFVLGVFSVRLSYHFEDHPVTRAR